MQYDAFLSYNNKDHQAVEPIAHQLREKGLKVFLDRWYLKPGIPWTVELENSLNQCSAVVVFLGPHGLGRWQQREKEIALDRQAQNPLTFPVIPVLLTGSEPPLGFLSLSTRTQDIGQVGRPIFSIVGCDF